MSGVEPEKTAARSVPDVCRVSIEATEIVSLDRALYGFSRGLYERLLTNLRSDPFLGSRHSDGHYEYGFNDLSVKYFADIGPNGVYVLIVGIRPVEEISQLDRIRKLSKQIIGILKEIQSLIKMV